VEEVLNQVLEVTAVKQVLVQVVLVGAEVLQGELVDLVVPELLYWCRGNR
jgi:hypothetical protein